jgi:hypothetical protein
MKILRDYTPPQFLLRVEGIIKLILKKSLEGGGISVDGIIVLFIMNYPG